MTYFLTLIITEGKTGTELESFIKRCAHRSNTLSDLKILVPLPELLRQGEGKEHCTDC